MHRLRTFLLLSFTLLAFPAFAATLNVGQGQTYSTIQSAIVAANNGDTILVFPGTYTENLDYSGKALNVVSTPAPTGGPSNTIIDGGKIGTVVYLGTVSGIASATLNGFTIQNGYPEPSHGSYYESYNYGGGVVVVGNANVLNNVVQNNSTCGIDVHGGNTLIQNNQILSNFGANTAGADCRINGYGILVHDNFSASISINIVSNIVEQNKDGGIGLYNLETNTPVNITQNIIRSNGLTSSFGEGAGVSLGDFAAANVIGNLITNNANQGIYQFLNNGLTVTNNTIYSNSVHYIPQYAYQGTELQLGSVDTQAVLVNNIIVGTNAAYPVVSCGSVPAWDHNLIYNTSTQSGSIPCFTDPTAKNLYVDPKLINPAGGDFHLSTASPAIDAGNNSAPLLTTTDLDGNPRKQDATLKGYPIVDIGAYEYTGVVDTSPTTLSLTPSQLTVSAGSSITATVTAASALGVPTGPITLLEDGNQIGVANLNGSGVITFTVGSLTPGFHGLIATYPGQAPFTPAVSVVVVIDVGKYNVALTLTSSNNPSILGSAVTFTVHTSGADGSIPSPITLTDGGTQLTTLTPDSSGAAAYTTSSLIVGYHSITAAYAGDASHNSNSASVYQQVIDPNSTTTVVTSAPNPSVLNSAVIFTAKVSSAGGAIPTGTVTFTYGSTVLGSQAVSGSPATASVTNSALPLGFDYVTAAFVGSGGFENSSGSTSQNVITGYTTTSTLTSSVNPSAFGQSITFTATVTSSSGTPTGSVTFADGGTTLQTTTLSPTGIASFATSTLAVGSHNITATYVPTGSFAASSASLLQVVKGLASSSVLTASPGTAVYNGAPITLTANVAPATPPGSGTPTGTVTFIVDGVSGTAQAITSGTATLSLTGLAGGTHTFGCQYSGDSTYSASTCNSASATITAAPTALTLTSSLSPAPALTAVKFTTVLRSNGVAAGAGNSISLFLSVGSAPVLIPLTTDSTGSASYTISTLTPGSYPVSATFAGNSNLQASTATGLTEVITAIPTTTTLTASPNPAYQSQTVTFTATVASPSTTFAAGTISFYDATSLLGSSAVNATGIATFSTNKLAIGSHPISATFTPSAGSYFNSSTAATVNEVINLSSFTLALSPSTLNIVAGKSGTTTLQLASIGNFSGPLTLSFGTLPQYSNGSLSAPTATLISGGTSSATFTIQTSTLASSTVPARPGSRALPTTLCMLLMLLPFSFRSRRRLRGLLVMFAAAALLQTLTGCTNIYIPFQLVAAGTYQVPVTATDMNSNTQTQMLTVVVTP